MLSFSSTCSLFGGCRFHTWDSEENRKEKLAGPFIFTFRYIDDVLSLNNCIFFYLVEHIYPIELKIKHTIDTTRPDSYLDLHIEVDNEDRLRTKLYDKRKRTINDQQNIHIKLKIE